MPFLQGKSVGQALACSDASCFAQQIRVEVDPSNRVGACGATRDLTQDHPGSAADFEDRLSRSHLNGIQQSAYHSHVRRSTPRFEKGDGAERGPAQSKRAVFLAERRGNRLPLRRSQVEWHQDKRLASPANTVGDARHLALLLRQSRPCDRVPLETIEKLEHCASDFGPTIR